MKMGDIIKFGMRTKTKKPEPPKKFRFMVNWKNVTHLERLPEDGCKIFFIGGNFIIVDRMFDDVEKIAKAEWSKDK